MLAAGLPLRYNWEMVTIFTTTLGISIFGMLALLLLKRYELKTGHVLFAGLRPRVNRVFKISLFYVERVLPALVLFLAERSVRSVVTVFHRLTAQGIVFVEYWLERVLETLRMTTHIPHSEIPASAFLREVAEHKKTILKRAPAVVSAGRRVQRRSLASESQIG